MFNEETTLKKIMSTKNGIKVLTENGIPCISCPFAAEEVGYLKIGEVSEKYGLDKNKIINELNRNCCENQ